MIIVQDGSITLRDYDFWVWLSTQDTDNVEPDVKEFIEWVSEMLANLNEAADLYDRIEDNSRYCRQNKKYMRKKITSYNPQMYWRFYHPNMQDVIFAYKNQYDYTLQSKGQKGLSKLSRINLIKEINITKGVV